MAVNLSPVYGVAGQLFNDNGDPLAGGKIYTYLAGTTTNAATYTNASGNIAHSNPIVLDGAGRVPSGEIWLTDGISYKFVVEDSANNLIGTYDNIIGINSSIISYTSQQEIQTATAGQTVFTLTTMQYAPGTNSLSVFVDGINQYGPGAQYAFVETNSTTITFNSGLNLGAEVKFTTSQLNTSGAVDSSQVSYIQDGTDAVATNVQTALRRIIFIEDFGADPVTGANFSSALNNALAYMANELQLGQAGLVGGMITTSTPGVKWIATAPIIWPGINYQYVYINGSIDASALTTGETLLEFGTSYCRFECTGEIGGPGTSGTDADFCTFDQGNSNVVVINEIHNWRYGFRWVNDGNGAKLKVENKVWFNVVRQCNIGFYIETRTAGTTDPIEGTELRGGLLINCLTYGVLIGSSVNANYGYFEGAIDVGAGKDFENQSADSGWTWNCKYLHDPSFYVLGPKDTLLNGPVNGFDLTGVDNSAPAVRVKQTNVYSVPASIGKASHFISAGDAQDGTTMQGALVGNSYLVSSSSSAGLFYGYISNAAASSGWTAFTAGYGRATGDNTAVLGSGTYYTRRAGSNLSDVFFKNASGTQIGALYSEGTRLNIPTSLTPANTADSQGNTGDIAWDASYIYVKTGAGWKRATLNTF